MRSSWGCTPHPKCGEAALTGEGTLLLIIGCAVVILFGWLALAGIESTEERARAYANRSLQRLLFAHDGAYFASNLSVKARPGYPPNNQKYLISSLTKLGVPTAPLKIDGAVAYGSEPGAHDPTGRYDARAVYPSADAQFHIDVCLISLLLLLGQAALIICSIFLGNLTTFLLSTGLGLFALLLLYFIWIGHNWPRWLIAPLYAFSGFANLIWGIVHGNGPLFLLGLGGLTVFTYLALAPSVYAFARHQRERVQWVESLVVGGIFLLVAASVGCGLYGFYVYDTDLQEQATNFAGTTFNKVFLYHDEDFLRNNLKDEERTLSPHMFIERINHSFGQPHWAGTLRGVFYNPANGAAADDDWHFPIPRALQRHRAGLDQSRGLANRRGLADRSHRLGISAGKNQSVALIFSCRWQKRVPQIRSAP